MNDLINNSRIKDENVCVEINGKLPIVTNPKWHTLFLIVMSAPRDRSRATVDFLPFIAAHIIGELPF